MRGHCSLIDQVRRTKARGGEQSLIRRLACDVEFRYCLNGRLLYVPAFNRRGAEGAASSSACASASVCLRAEGDTNHRSSANQRTPTDRLERACAVYRKERMQVCTAQLLPRSRAMCAGSVISIWLERARS